MAKKKKAGFGPRKLTQMAKVLPKQEELPPYADGEGGAYPVDPETRARAREIEVHPGTDVPTPAAVAQARTELRDQEIDGLDPGEGVAPQAHAPDEVLDVPWDPGVPSVDHVQRGATSGEGDDLVTESEAVGERGQLQIRVQSSVKDEDLKAIRGRILREEHYNTLITGPALVRKPDGSLLCIYLPGALESTMDDAYALLTKIPRSQLLNDNRGLASGSLRVKAGVSRYRGKHVLSAVLGSMDPVISQKYCRLTAFTAKNMDKWDALLPLWQAIAKYMEEHVPDRFAAQMTEAAKAHPEWVIPGTPFSTVTINSCFPTGVHKDSGDFGEGFSTLAVARNGPYTGGALTFPQYQIGVDMQHGDLLLMDSHTAHGNTLMHCACDDGSKPLVDGPCKECGAERISLVAYLRTKIVDCETFDREMEKKAAYGTRRLDEADEIAEDLASVASKS